MILLSQAKQIYYDINHFLHYVMKFYNFWFHTQGDFVVGKPPYSL